MDDHDGTGEGYPMSDDWYHGHKVVAMPSSAFGGKSIREVVSSRNENDQQQPQQRPRRTNSLGRQPMVRPGGRNLVQDVYDRMGVSYTRGMTYESNSNEPYPQESQITIQSQASFSESIASNNTNNTNNNNNNGGVTGGKLRDKFSGRYRNAAAVSTAGRAGTATAAGAASGAGTRGRGRDMEPCVNGGGEKEECEFQKRARSLSRGRSVSDRWPPARSQANIEINQYANPAGAATAESSTATPSGGNLHQQTAPPSPERTMKPKRSHSVDARPQYGRGGGNIFRSPLHHNKMRVAAPEAADPIHPSSNTNTRRNNDMATVRDEKKENDDASESSAVGGNEGAADNTSVPSIQDRISAFAGKKATPDKRSSRRNTFAGTSPGYSRTPPPPKVDIYEQSSRNKQDEVYGHPDDPNIAFDTQENNNPEDEYSQSQGPPEPSSVPPSATAAAAADVAAKYKRPSQMKTSPRHSTGGNSRKGSAIANSYLTGINSPGGNNNTNSNGVISRSSFQQQQQQATSGSFAEVPFMASDEVMDGPASVGASSTVSHGDSTPQRKSTSVWQKPHGAYSSSNNNNSSNSNNGGIVTNNSTPNKSNASGIVSSETIEKMVDERVQVQLREVEARMEGLLRRWMDQMNNKITTRLDAMESSIKDSMPDTYHP